MPQMLQVYYAWLALVLMIVGEALTLAAPLLGAPCLVLAPVVGAAGLWAYETGPFTRRLPKLNVGWAVLLAWLIMGGAFFAALYSLAGYSFWYSFAWVSGTDTINMVVCVSLLRITRGDWPPLATLHKFPADR